MNFIIYAYDASKFCFYYKAITAVTETNEILTKIHLWTVSKRLRLNCNKNRSRFIRKKKPTAVALTLNNEQENMFLPLRAQVFGFMRINYGLNI